MMQFGYNPALSSSQRKRGGTTMKRFAALLAAMALMLSLAACGVSETGGAGVPVNGMTDRMPRIAVSL